MTIVSITAMIVAVMLRPCLTDVDVDSVQRYAHLRSEIAGKALRDLIKLQKRERNGEEVTLHQVHEVMRKGVKKHASEVFSRINSHLPDHRYSTNVKSRLIEGVNMEFQASNVSIQKFVMPLSRTTLLYKLEGSGMMTTK